MKKNIFVFVFLSTLLFSSEGFNILNLIKKEFQFKSVGEIYIGKNKKKFNSYIKYTGVYGQKDFYGKKYNISSLSEIKKFGDDVFEERYIFLTDANNNIPYIAILRFFNNKKKIEKKCELSTSIKKIPNIVKENFTTGEVVYTCFDSNNISIEITVDLLNEKMANVKLNIYEYDDKGNAKIIQNIFTIDNNGSVLEFKKNIF